MLRLFFLAVLACCAAPIAGMAAAPDDGEAAKLRGLIGGVQIRSGIDVSSLPRGQVHRFYLPAGRMASGQDWLVPVVVIRGAQDGPRLTLTAGVHGDELSGIGVAHHFVDTMTPSDLSGTLTILPGVNVPGILAGTRGYPFANGTGGGTNLNREMPGSLTSADPGVRYAAAVWRGILQGNADYAIDLHTQSTGTAYPLYVFADYRNKRVKEMAELLGAQMIKIDTGQKGTVETAFNQAGVPAVTLEIGGAKTFDYPLIARAAEGIERFMIAKGMLPGALPAVPASQPIIGNDTVGVEAVVAGFVTRRKELLDAVAEGEVVAVTRDPFGRIIHEYKAPVSGHVAAINTDPLREEGSLIIRILTTNKSKACRNGC